MQGRLIAAATLALRQAVERESSEELRGDMRQVLAQLESNAGCR